MAVLVPKEGVIELGDVKFVSVFWFLIRGLVLYVGEMYFELLIPFGECFEGLF